jgi:hypothetical protein
MEVNGGEWRCVRAGVRHQHANPLTPSLTTAGCECHMSSNPSSTTSPFFFLPAHINQPTNETPNGPPLDERERVIHDEAVSCSVMKLKRVQNCMGADGLYPERMPVSTYGPHDTESFPPPPIHPTHICSELRGTHVTRPPLQLFPLSKNPR